MKKILLPLTAALFLISCQKELSTELPGGNTNNPGTNPNPPLGANCKLQKVIAVDTATGTGLLSFYTAFQQATGIASKVEVYDSTSSSMGYEATIQYTGDTVRISDAEYFLLDANKRVKSFHTIDPTGSVQDEVTYQYQYDGNGYLISKELYISTLPIPIFRFSYVWSGQNLVSLDGILAGSTQKVLSATLEYDANATAKNFIPVYPDGFETSLFVMALDLGKPSKNLVKKITISSYDENGNLDQTSTTSYGNYKYSSDGYLIQWDVTGEPQGGSPFIEGRNTFKYFCR